MFLKSFERKFLNVGFFLAVFVLFAMVFFTGEPIDFSFLLGFRDGEDLLYYFIKNSKKNLVILLVLRSFSLSSIITGTLEFSKAFNKSATMGDQTQQQLADTYTNTGVLIPLPLLADLLKAFLNSGVPVIMEPKENERSERRTTRSAVAIFHEPTALQPKSSPSKA